MSHCIPPYSARVGAKVAPYPPTRRAVIGALVALLVPASALAAPATSWPLGHHSHQFQGSDAQIWSQGWDPAYKLEDRSDKLELVSSISTFSVGLPGSLEPEDLANTHCPASTQINGLSDVEELPRFCDQSDCDFPALSGVSGTVYLISQCNRSESDLNVENGLHVAVWSSAFEQVGSDDDSDIWFIDSLANADHDAAAGVNCGGGSCYILHSEILGGNDGTKIRQGDVFYKTHVHGYDRTPGAGDHSDGMQANPGKNMAVINSTIEGPFRQSTQSLRFVSSGGKTMGDIYIADTLAGGSNQAIVSMGAKDGSYWEGDAVLWNNRFLGADGNTSWPKRDQNSGRGPCGFGSAVSEEERQGEGNMTSSADVAEQEFAVDFNGNSWTIANCNYPSISPVSQSSKNTVTQKAAQMETWINEVRAAVGYEPANDPPDEQTLQAPALPKVLQ